MKKIKNVKLSVKLITVGILAVLFPMLILGIISVKTASNALLDSGRESTFRIAQDLAMTTEIFMTEEMKFANAMALSHGLSQRLKLLTRNKEASKESLAALDDLFKTTHDGMGEDYDLFFIADPNGNILADSMDGALRNKKVNVGDRAYFKAAQAGKPVIGPPIKSRASGRSVVVVAVPLVDAGEFMGLFASVLRLDALSVKLASVRIGETGYVYMVDRDGITIAHPKEAYIFKMDITSSKGMETISRRIANKESGIESYTFEGVKKEAGFAHIPITGWSVCATVDHDELMAPALKMTLYNSTAGAVVLVIVGGLLFLAGLTIITPINRAVAGLKDVSDGEGDLTRRLVVNGRDEIGILSFRFNAFIKKLHAMVTDISAGIETLSGASAKLSAISEEMSSGAGQTSDKAETVATASREMTANMDSVSAAMDQSSTNINTVAGAAEEMNATINEIAQNAEKASQVSAGAVSKVKTATGNMKELGSAAQSIGQVVETITDISEQVNLLALNATIEAARAGEAGRGFAVVANEIKELAGQTSNASMDIKENIDNIQTSSTATLGGMEEVSQVIADVNEIVSAIAAAVEEQSSAIREISENISQASTGIEEVNLNVNESSGTAHEITMDIGEVNQAAGRMRDRSGQVQTSAGELSGLAAQLNEMVGRFKI